MNNSALSDKRKYLIFFATALLSSTMIWGCLDAPFFGLDDEQYLVNNDQLAPETSWKELFRLQNGQNFYYPVTVVSWRLDRMIWEQGLGGLLGPHAWATGIRIGNLVLHLLAALMLWRILGALRVPREVAFFAVFGFSVHPYAAEMLAWPIERKSVLAVFLGFAAFDFYLRAESKRGYLLAAVLYGLALLAKPSALGVFAMVGVWELFGRPRFPEQALNHAIQAERNSKNKNLSGDEVVETKEAGVKGVGWRGWFLSRAPGLLPWLFLSIAGAAIGFYTHKVNVLQPPGGSVWTALLTDVVILKKYFLGLLVPMKLSAYYYVQPVTSLADLSFWWALICVGALVGLTFFLAARSQRRFLGFVWLWFLGAMGPHLNLIAVNDLMHDRFIYFSIPAFWLALGIGLYGLVGGERFRSRRDVRRGVCLGVAALALFWAYLGYLAGARYTDMEKVMEHAKTQEPNSSYAHLLYADALNNKLVRPQLKTSDAERDGIWLKMLAAMRQGVACPDYDRYIFKLRAHQTLAYLYYTFGQMEDARGQALLAFTRYRESNHARKNIYASKAMQTMGQIALRQGAAQDALEQFEMAFRLTPNREVLYYYLGSSLYELYAKARSVRDDSEASKLKLKSIRFLERVSVRGSFHKDAQHLLAVLSEEGP